MNAAVVTGASMGLGEEYARQLAARGVNLVLVARSADKLEALASELQGRHKIRAVAMACDLSLPGAAEQVRAFLSERNIHPTWLVNNAGFGLVGGFDAMDFDRVHSMIQLNVAALVELTHKLLPQLRLARDSRIINVASTASFQPIAFFSVYAATKVFVLHFSEALHEELRGTEVRVLAVCPGPTPTKFAENNGLSPKFFEKGQSAQEVVRLSLRASDRRRAVLICQRGWAVFLQKLLPRFIIRYVAGQVARAMMRRGVTEKETAGK